MSFDRLAPHYRWMEALLAGGVLQRARLAHLPALDGARHVLLVGEGPGRFLAAVLARGRVERVTVVDASARMLHEAARACHGAGRARVEFVQADLRTWAPPAATFDGVVTPCVLDCFGPEMVRTIVHRLAGAATPRARWLHIDFAIPATGWRSRRARAIHRVMYATFRRLTEIEARSVCAPDCWLRACGFTRQAAVSFSAGLIRSEHWRRG